MFAPLYHGVHFRHKLPCTRNVVSAQLHPRLQPPGSGVDVGAHEATQLLATLLSSTGKVMIFDITNPFISRMESFNTFDLAPFGLVDIVPIVPHGIYAACSHEETLKFFDAKFQHICNVLAWAPVLSLSYNSALGMLLAIGTDTVSFWHMNTFYERGRVKVVAEEKGRIKISSDSMNWISCVHCVPACKKFFIAMGATIYAYSITYQLLSTFELRSEKKITCLVYSNDLQYLFSSSCDGCIQVWESNCTMLHEFTTKGKAITSLIIYAPNLLLSCSIDRTVRIWDTKVFQQCLLTDIGEQVCEIKVLRENILGVLTPSSYSIWSIYFLKRNFALLSSNITYIRTFFSNYTYPKVLYGSNDGVWRLSSPQTTKVLTTCIPVHQRSAIRDVAFSPDSEKIFFLLENGDIWVGTTIKNPAIFTDLWKSPPGAPEICTAIGCADFCIENQFYTVLFGGTSAGQLVLYSSSGHDSRRWNMHSLSILKLQIESEQMLICSLGKDLLIKISDIIATKGISLSPKYTIQLQQIPAAFCVCGDTVLSVSSRGVVMFSQPGMQHKAPGFDHMDSGITCLDLKRHKLYATLGLDGILKIWDEKKTLAREILFDRAPSAAFVLNEDCDILLVWGPSIDILRYQDYLPKSLIISVENEKYYPEEPLPLEDHATLQLSKAKSKQLLARGNFLQLLNFCPKFPKIMRKIETTNPEPQQNQETVLVKEAPDDNTDMLSVYTTMMYQNRSIPLGNNIVLHEKLLEKPIWEKPREIEPEPVVTKRFFAEGCFPNSFVQKFLNPIQLKTKLQKQKKVVQEEIKVEEKQERTNEYRKRLQYLISMMPQKEKPKEVIEKPDSAKRPHSNVKNSFAAPKKLPPKKELEPIPLMVQKAIEFQIFQEKELFELQKNEDGNLHRKWIIEPTAEGMQPYLLAAFKDADTLTKKEIVKFINWLHDNYTFQNPHPIIESYIHFMLQNMYATFNALLEDISLFIIEFLKIFTPNIHDSVMFFSILVLVDHPYLESIAIEKLKSLGVSDPESSLFKEEMEKVYDASFDKAKEKFTAWIQAALSKIQGELNKEVSIVECINFWIQKVKQEHKRQEEIAKELAQKLKLEAAEKAQAKKKKKKEKEEKPKEPKEPKKKVVKKKKETKAVLPRLSARAAEKRQVEITEAKKRAVKMFIEENMKLKSQAPVVVSQNIIKSNQNLEERFSKTMPVEIVVPMPFGTKEATLKTVFTHDSEEKIIFSTNKKYFSPSTEALE